MATPQSQQQNGTNRTPPGQNQSWWQRFFTTSAISLPPPPVAPRPGIMGFLRDLWGGWAGARYSRGTPAADDLPRERINVGPAGIIMPRFARWLTDDVETAEMRRAYRKMLANGYVKSALLSKLWGVTSLDLQIHPTDKNDPRAVEIADFVRWNLTENVAGGTPQMLESILLGALVDGYSVCDIVLDNAPRGRWAGKWVLKDLKPKEVYKDCILEIDQFFNVVAVRGMNYNAGEHYHPGHFVIYKNLPLFGEPLGMSDLRAAYAAWWRLDSVEKLRLIGIERRAIPYLLGTYENATNQPQLDAMLAAMKSQGWGSVPDSVKVEALDIAASSNDIYTTAVRDYKHDVIQAINFAVLQALEGQTTDGAGNSQVHKSTADLAKWHLAQSVQAKLNEAGGLIASLVDLNYVTDAYPRVTLSAVDLTEMSAELSIAERLNGLGIDLSIEQIREKFSWEAPKNFADRLAGKTASAPTTHGGPPGSPPGKNPLTVPRPFAEPVGVPARPFRDREQWLQWLQQQRNGNGN